MLTLTVADMLGDACQQERVEELSGATFNSCLLNFYRTGMDHLSWHSDNEPLYGSGSYTIGEQRASVV